LPLGGGMNADFLHVAKKAALAGAKAIQRVQANGFRVRYKAARNLLTEADLASQAAVQRVLSKAFPDHNLLMEENLDLRQGSEYTWLVDPLDGTTNFAHGFPMYAVSIGLARGKEPLVGVVYHVPAKEWFVAVKGRGAYLNGERIHVSRVKRLERALVATGFPYKDPGVARQTVHDIGRLWKKVEGIRRAGAAALDLCFVACGRLDAFWEHRLSPWDLAAGQLVLREAGGKATDFMGRPVDAFADCVVASNKAIHLPLLKALGGRK